MTCIILDDEPHAIEVLKRYVEQVTTLQLKGTFRNPLKALDSLRQEKVDLLFLDVNMPNLTGIQVLKSLQHQPLIIFTTAYSTYAAESYEWNAVDYLVKPILFERFLRAVNKAHELNKITTSDKIIPQENNTTTQDFILLKSGAQTHRVKLSDILFVEKEGNYLGVHLLEKKIMIRANMNDIHSWLPELHFCRIHKSFVVAVRHVDTIEVHQVKINKTNIPLGASYRGDFLSRMKN